MPILTLKELDEMDDLRTDAPRLEAALELAYAALDIADFSIWEADDDGDLRLDVPRSEWSAFESAAMHFASRR